MFRTLYAMRHTLDFYERGTKVKTSPGTGLINFLIVAGTASMAEWAIILMPFICPSVDPEVAYTILI
jgi:hypothetical protein